MLGFSLFQKKKLRKNLDKRKRCPHLCGVNKQQQKPKDMNFFNSPMTAEQFHNALKQIQKTSDIVAAHNQAQPERELWEAHLSDWNADRAYHQSKPENKALVLTLMTEDDVNSYIESKELVTNVREYAASLRITGNGLLAAVEGNSQARRDRLFLTALEHTLETCKRFESAIASVFYSFGDGKYELKPFPTTQAVKELSRMNNKNDEGLKYETCELLSSITSAANHVMYAIKALPFPQNSKAELLDEANALLKEGVPRVYDGKMGEALVRLMQGLAPKGCVEADLGVDWVRPMRALTAFDTLRECVQLDEKDAARVSAFRANLVEWIEKRAQVAQG
jgi:hypothetical protein